MNGRDRQRREADDSINELRSAIVEEDDEEDSDENATAGSTLPEVGTQRVSLADLEDTDEP